MIFALEQYRRGNMHENADDNRHQVARINCEAGVAADKHSNRCHNREQAETHERRGFFHAALQQHSEQRDGDGIIMHDDADEEKMVRGQIVRGLMFR